MHTKATLLAAVMAASLAARIIAAESPAGFTPLFNGKDLAGWDGNPKFWSVQDGVITGQTTAANPTSGNTFLMWRGGTVSDFELRLSYRLVGGNSGIQYRSKDLGKWVAGGYQADIEAGANYTGILYEERGRGILAKRGEKTRITPEGKIEVVGSLGKADELQKSIRPEQWNDYVIIARGNRIIHKINGKTMVEVVDDQPERRASSGILALQLHAGPPMLVQFRHLFLKPLSSR
ncbi:MAG TPA: DUF1080 domain-containing protein [Candidatus Paceibacterota bacterium]|nr:DUF1080 domain-containing protein [Verrucomicrobiota bacterium]HRZ43720.1 DUF1080 domain-containing protein [Candidatus Paceibacterota bacterium]HRZ93620.1 DUF1080 domain-containing protein [Candidatus Paceibacterota bacterium]